MDKRQEINIQNIMRQRGMRANWLLFALLATMVFIKCCLGHYFLQHSILVASLWNHPLYFWSFYLPKIAISLLFGSSVFFIKNKWWMVIICLLIDIWLWTNLLYFRVYGGVIDGYVLMMTSNLKGFTSSIFALMEWKDSLIFLLTGILAICVYLLRNEHCRDWRRGVMTLMISSLVWAGASNLNFIRYQVFLRQENVRIIAPSFVFYAPFGQTTRSCVAGTAPYYDFSLLHMFFFAIDDLVMQLIGIESIPDIADEDLKIIQSLQGSQYCINNGHKMILVVFESLEDWVVQPEFMPNTYKLLESGHSFHAHRIAKQAMAGGSADGQMIINTGLLPIDKGAVCFSYPFNVFPSLPKKQAVTYIPHPIDVWNQKCMSPAYGYDTTVVVGEESAAFEKTTSALIAGYDMVQIITITSHEPFHDSDLSHLQLSHDMPELMAAYIKSVNVTDEYIGRMMQELCAANLMDSTTIVITGDHTIFHKERRDAFTEYFNNKDVNYGVEYAYCPLIIYSLEIKGDLQCYTEGYQMDVYPTILGVIGYKDYYWRGFGINLLDSTHLDSRDISEKDALRLSNIMIRNNYFSNFENKQQ